ncbi:hypothetical protein J4209_02895 [Candidatus Woesearchaeota archaeon]|nr:hypothetical protein [Candidatus Woesearchaeota archaeon]
MKTHILEGNGIGKEIVSGKIVLIHPDTEVDKIGEGNIIVTDMTHADQLKIIKTSVGIITDKGGLSCHAALIGRELNIPTIVGTENATKKLIEGQKVTLDCRLGKVYEGDTTNERFCKPTHNNYPIYTATEVRINLSMNESLQNALKLAPDGIGLVRLENIILCMGKTPMELINQGKTQEYEEYLINNLQPIMDAMYPYPVRLRTIDLPTDEFEGLVGSHKETKECNPMLGYRGLRRDLLELQHFMAELRVFKKLYDMGYSNMEIMFPFVQHPKEFSEAKRYVDEIGLKKVKLGIMVEIPSSAILINDFIKEGIKFITLGTNDLIQFTLAVDRNNAKISKLFDAMHPSVTSLILNVLSSCQKNGVETAICGEAGSNPEMINLLVRNGINCISCNIDAIQDVKKLVYRIEKQIMLEHSIKK